LFCPSYHPRHHATRAYSGWADRLLRLISRRSNGPVIALVACARLGAAGTQPCAPGLWREPLADDGVAMAALRPPPTSCDGCEFRAGLPGCSFRLEIPRMLAALVLLALAGMNFSPGALGQEAILRRKGMA
jgi:hypothetical protein